MKYRITSRIKNAKYLSHDSSNPRRPRWVVYRRAGKVERKTSVRHSADHRGFTAALEVAEKMAARIAKCPPSKLSAFRFRL